MALDPSGLARLVHSSRAVPSIERVPCCAHHAKRRGTHGSGTGRTGLRHPFKDHVRPSGMHTGSARSRSRFRSPKPESPECSRSPRSAVYRACIAAPLASSLVVSRRSVPNSTARPLHHQPHGACSVQAHHIRSVFRSLVLSLSRHARLSGSGTLSYRDTKLPRGLASSLTPRSGRSFSAVNKHTWIRMCVVDVSSSRPRRRATTRFVMAPRGDWLSGQIGDIDVVLRMIIITWAKASEDGGDGVGSTRQVGDLDTGQGRRLDS